MVENESQQSKPLTPSEQSLKSQSELEPVVIPTSATVYANNLGIGMTVFDIIVTFGEVVAVKDGRAVIQQRVKVIMSPLLAKMAARSLVKSVSDYEGQFGTINEPEGAAGVVEKTVAVQPG